MNTDLPQEDCLGLDAFDAIHAVTLVNLHSLFIISYNSDMSELQKDYLYCGLNKKLPERLASLADFTILEAKELEAFVDLEEDAFRKVIFEIIVFNLGIFIFSPACPDNVRLAIRYVNLTNTIEFLFKARHGSDKYIEILKHFPQCIGEDEDKLTLETYVSTSDIVSMFEFIRECIHMTPQEFGEYFTICTNEEGRSITDPMSSSDVFDLFEVTLLYRMHLLLHVAFDGKASKLSNALEKFTKFSFSTSRKERKLWDQPANRYFSMLTKEMAYFGDKPRAWQEFFENKLSVSVTNGFWKSISVRQKKWFTSINEISTLVHIAGILHIFFNMPFFSIEDTRKMVHMAFSGDFASEEVKKVSECLDVLYLVHKEMNSFTYNEFKEEAKVSFRIIRQKLGVN